MLTQKKRDKGQVNPRRAKVGDGPRLVLVLIWQGVISCLNFSMFELHSAEREHLQPRQSRPPTLTRQLVAVPMASKRPLRSLVSTASSSLRPAQTSKATLVRTSACAFSSTTPSRAPGYDTDVEDRPRWQKTPQRMVAPFRIRPQARGGVFKVNEDPKRLDEAYVRMLGPGGDKVLGDEVKWLAVTHKSFEHGKQGFNDRLAYLGMWGGWVTSMTRTPG